MLKPFMAALVVVGVAAAGCSSGGTVDSSAADVQVVYFGTDETKMMKRALGRYRDSFDDAVSGSSVKRCNDALDYDDTGCFAGLAESVDRSVDRLFDQTPARSGYHPDCRAGLKKWMRFLVDYRRFTEKLSDYFAEAEYNDVIKGLERYPRLVEFEARMQDKALPKLVAGCYPDGGGENLLVRPGRLG